MAGDMLAGIMAYTGGLIMSVLIIARWNRKQEEKERKQTDTLQE